MRHRTSGWVASASLFMRTRGNANFPVQQSLRSAENFGCVSAFPIYFHASAKKPSAPLMKTSWIDAHRSQFIVLIAEHTAQQRPKNMTVFGKAVLWTEWGLKENYGSCTVWLCVWMCECDTHKQCPAKCNDFGFGFPYFIAFHSGLITLPCAIRGIR